MFEGVRPQWANLERLQEAVRTWPDRHPRSGAAAMLVARTVRSALRVRIIGLAAESAFFSLLSLPSLLLGLVGTLGHLSSVLGHQTVVEIRAWMLDLAATVLTAEAVQTTVEPLVDDFLGGAHGGVLSLTFLVSLWSGSRAMSVFIEAITIAYGLEGMRGYLRRRLLAFVAYLGALLFALVVLPAVVAGPAALRALLPAADTGLRLYLEASFGQVNLYGPLTAPIIIVIWLYLTALAVLAGSSLNAEIDAMWPVSETARARAELAARRQASAVRLAERHEQALQRIAQAREQDTRVAESRAGKNSEVQSSPRPDRAAAARRRPARPRRRRR